MSETKRWKRAGSVCFPACDERVEAQAAGLFFYHSQFNAFVFTDSPPRKMTFAAKVRMERHLKGQGDYVDYSDEPFRWHECPWCGADLPLPGLILPSHGGEGEE